MNIGFFCMAYQKHPPYNFKSFSLDRFSTVFSALPVAFLWYVFFSFSGFLSALELSLMVVGICELTGCVKLNCLGLEMVKRRFEANNATLLQDNMRLRESSGNGYKKSKKCHRTSSSPQLLHDADSRGVTDKHQYLEQVN
jgi:hypothetical protein